LRRCRTDAIRLYPLYAKAQELGIPVMWHTGSSVFKGSRLKYGDPLYIDDVAVDFPELERVADKTLFGSDWPSVPTIRKNIETIRSLPLSEKAKAQILGGNAARLLKLPA
jgi:predicted TIM-barrel fold metal-dependent hydrolase